jgi:hypothetical protein
MARGGNTWILGGSHAPINVLHRKASLAAHGFAFYFLPNA